MKRPSQSQRGFVLAATLWTMALITVGVGFFASRMESARRLALLAQTHTATMVEMSSARAEILFRIATTPISLYGLGTSPANMVALDDRPYRMANGERVQLQDDRGLINLNIADDARLDRFLGVMGVPFERRAPLIDALRDYIDEDSLKRLNGAEAPEYLAAGLPPPHNGRLITPAEAHRIFGWASTPELWKGAGIEPLVTTSGSFSMNPNTAPWQVLASMRGMTPEGAQAIIAARKRGPIVSSSQIAALTGIQVIDDPFMADVVAFPADSMRVTQSAPGAGWGWRYNVTLTPVSLSAPWRIDYFYRVELPPPTNASANAEAAPSLPPRAPPATAAVPFLLPTP
jgi:type II secretory pathway component PulK